VSSKAYFRWLAFFVALLGVAQIGWVTYFLTPRKPGRPDEMKYLAFRRFSSPTFKYQFQVESGDRPKWKEVEISAATGQKFLDLLRGSKNSAVVMREYLSQHPEMAKGLITPFWPDSAAQLNVYEDGADNPSLSIDFQRSRQVIVSGPDRQSQTFLIRPERQQELGDLTADIQFGPFPKDEPPEE